MEGIDAYAFHQELNHQTSMNNPKNRILETISSWLDLDIPNTPSFPQELQDLQMLDEHFFQFATTQIDSEPLPNLPRPDSPFILDLHEFDDNNPPPPSNGVNENPINTNCYQPTLLAPEDVECEMFLNVIAESPESMGGVDQFFVQSDDHHENFNIMTNSSSSTELHNTKRNQKKQKQKQQQHQKQQQKKKKRCSVSQNESTTNVDDDDDDDDDDEEEEEDQEIGDEPKRGTLNCKNLVSERNRRKRLSQQLLALRALVPNITKMDKRSVLVDALSYLKNMQEETARIQKELKEHQKYQQQMQQQPGFMNESCQLDDDNFPGSNSTPRILAAGGPSKPKPQIIEIDIEKIEEKRFIVKVTCKGANGIGGDVLRVIESIGFEITYAALDQIKPQHVLTTIFIRVKKQENMTEEKLKDCIVSSALRSGLTLLHRC